MANLSLELSPGSTPRRPTARLVLWPSFGSLTLVLSLTLPSRRELTSRFVATARLEESGATSRHSKARFQSIAHGNEEVTVDTTPIDYEMLFSDSVLTEIQLRSLLVSFRSSAGRYVALPVTPTPGSIAIANFDTTVWPAWIRNGIKEKLLVAGGVPSESPLQILRDNQGKPCVQRVTSKDSSSTVTTAEPATEDDAPA